MNKNILKSLLSVAAVALMCLGCQSGYYNENYLDGYEKIDQITDVQTVELTLDADHYAAIAKNSDNKDIAQEDGEQTVAALNALSKNHYFATADHAAMLSLHTSTSSTLPMMMVLLLWLHTQPL